jgi:integrase
MNVKKKDLVVKRLKNGDVKLVRRDGSSKLQAHVKKPNGGWLRRSTETTDIKVAEEFAEDLWRYLYFSDKYGDSLQPNKKDKSFHILANAANRKMQQAINKGSRSSKSLKDYIRINNEFNKPFFGNTPIDKITIKMLKELHWYKVDKFNNGRNYKKSTIQNHNSALSKVFSYAVEEAEVMKDYEVPKFPNLGDDGVKRKAFTADEVIKLRNFMREWKKTGHRAKTRELREILYDAYNILLLTGIRASQKEFFHLKWSDLELGEKPKGKDKDKKQLLYWNIPVDTKTGDRRVSCKWLSVSQYLHNRREWFDNLKDLEWENLFKSNEMIFRFKDGTYPHRYSDSFRQCLKASGLRKDIQKGRKSPLYCLRHTYINQQIYAGVPVAVIAKKSGNSIQTIQNYYEDLEPELMEDQFTDVVPPSLPYEEEMEELFPE